jgi:uncharacterized membrane protein YcaP (DUF421 family)
MKKEEIHWGDWYRILIGSAPETFLLEVLLRSIFMYLILLVVLRLMGKRMGGQLTISELAVMLTLGAIICVPMQIPDRGVLQGTLVLICALVFQRGLTLAGFNSSRVEEIMQGKECILVKNGVINVDELSKANISRQQLYAILRSQNIYNLGEVERIYLEACGLFSVYRFAEARPGLAISPANDHAIMEDFNTNDSLVCASCGQPAGDIHFEHERSCSNCNSKHWEPAILNL